MISTSTAGGGTTMMTLDGRPAWASDAKDKVATATRMIERDGKFICRFINTLFDTLASGFYSYFSNPQNDLGNLTLLLN